MCSLGLSGLRANQDRRYDHSSQLLPGLADWSSLVYQNDQMKLNQTTWAPGTSTRPTFSLDHLSD
jgi:hypothetical protein